MQSFKQSFTRMGFPFLVDVDIVFFQIVDAAEIN